MQRNQPTRACRSMSSTVMSFRGLPGTGFCPCKIAFVMLKDCENKMNEFERNKSTDASIYLGFSVKSLCVPIFSNSFVADGPSEKNFKHAHGISVAWRWKRDCTYMHDAFIKFAAVSLSASPARS